ncbi:trehalose-6-phosphate synthase [Rhodococcus sp. 3Y1]
MSVRTVPTFTTTCAENIQSLVVSGEIDVRSRADFAACVDDLIGERHPFVLDCSDVQFISVGGLSIIETLSAKARRLGVPWTLVAAHPVRRPLSLLKMDTDIVYTDSTADAVAYLSSTSVLDETLAEPMSAWYRSRKLSEFVVVANRLPVDLETDEDGSKNWKRSPGGLVTALEPILRQRDGAWVGWPGVADEKVDPIVVDGLRLFPVELTSRDLAEYYEGFSNDTLWPLYHDVLVAPTFERSWWHTYVAVNQRFAEETARCAADGATVWVQDYQLQLVPAMLRELRPDLTIGFFFISRSLRSSSSCSFRGARRSSGNAGRRSDRLPLTWWRKQFPVLGPQTSRPQDDDRGRRCSKCARACGFDSRVVKVGAFPISVDSAELERQSKSDSVLRRARELKEELGNRENLAGSRPAGLHKGIDLRLQALKELLDEDRLDPEKYTMVQLATPSRERVQHYIDLRSVIEEQVGRINGDHSQIGRPVVHYLYQPVDREELIALFVAADVMLVTPMRDGMNLVAKGTWPVVATSEVLSFSASSPVPQWNYDSHTWSTRTIWTA